MWTYVLIWGISLSVVGFALQYDDTDSVLDGNGAIIVLVLAPLLAVTAITSFVLLSLKKAFTYFTAENRHKRKLEAARRNRELWEAKHGISYDDLDTLVTLDDTTTSDTTTQEQEKERVHDEHV